ncbi:MAG: lipopolysaccharide biosynthesis protein [Clostridiales bacterium]|nr:lipopolysaccharide biosynthesis protein [Candidatus Crickella caballi]
MPESIRTILKKTNNIERSAYIWNAVNAIMSALESPVLLMVIMRTTGLKDAGIFSIAFAVAALLLYLGQYGFRRYQSSDVNEKYSFAEYYGSRIITCVAMFVAALAYCIYGSVFRGYSATKFAVVFLICALKGIQAFSDVLHGRMQQMGRLDVATKSSCIRYILEMLSFALVLVIADNLLLACIICFIVSLTEFFLTSYNVASDFCTLKPSYNKEKMKQMLIEGFPLFVSLFLNMYISNAPKYAIDAYLTEELQALYNMVFMPAFVIQLVAHFIFNPIITTYAEVWNNGNVKRFRKLVLRQCTIILGLTILAVAVALTIGIPVLGIIFNADLTAYKTELCIVCIGGGFLAYSVFFNTIITIIRMHKTLLYSYGVAALAALLLSKSFVINNGIMGAVLLYAVIIAALAIVLALITFIKIEKELRRTK